MLNNMIYSINGPVVTVKDSKDFSMLEMVYVGEKRLIGEVISVNDKLTTIQVYESTTGLRPGEPVEPTGAPMSATLGPGILSNIFESETLAILYNHLKLLPPECAKVMRLSLEGHKNPEIAEILSISINTVYAQKQKALTVLRNKLSKDMFVILLFSLFLHGE